MKIFYHSGDLDGHCSGAIVKHRYPDCEMFPMQYGDSFPWEKIIVDEEVWMVDFHLQPFRDMETLNKATKLSWIDHHKSVMDDVTTRGFVANTRQHLSVDHAACELTWHACFPNTLIPLSVTYLGRYDVWKYAECPGALEFQYGMRFQENTRPENQTFWREIFSDARTQELVALGKTLLTYEDRQNAKYCSSCAFEVTLDGLRCIALNRGMAGSLAFKSVYDPAKHDAMLSFVMRTPGQWTVSIYADKPEVDASVICKARGGGGHKGAAGFQCAVLPF
jgi:oligoribonuclease NrnB/cAMP/cGMP phosphodiesterase (DHH superfamily)